MYVVAVHGLCWCDECSHPGGLCNPALRTRGCPLWDEIHLLTPLDIPVHVQHDSPAADFKLIFSNGGGQIPHCCLRVSLSVSRILLESRAQSAFLNLRSKCLVPPTMLGGCFKKPKISEDHLCIQAKEGHVSPIMFLRTLKTATPLASRGPLAGSLASGPQLPRIATSFGAAEPTRGKKKEHGLTCHSYGVLLQIWALNVTLKKMWHAYI